jgi:hypothetical protein
MLGNNWQISLTTSGNSRDIVVGLATRYGLDSSEIESWWERYLRSGPDRPGTHPVSCTMSTGVSPGVNRPGVALTTHPI